MNRPSEATLIRFFQGLCPPDEEKAVRAYLAMDTDRDFVKACLHKAFPDLDVEHDPTISRTELIRAWNKLEARQRAHSQKTISLSRWYTTAAAVALIVMGSAAFFLFNRKPVIKNPAALVWSEVSAQTGHTKMVKLADSSTVILFPGSSLGIAADFNKRDRQIKLSGRAFFQVSQQKAKPFTVTAQSLTTNVLGTSFEINASTRATENTITLHTGKISVNRRGKEVARLMPNQQIRFSTKTGQFNIIPIQAASTIGWLNGELDYDQTPLNTIVADLEKWYGVTITADNPALLKQKVTIGFRDLPLATVLTMLTKSANFNYTIKDKHITIKERRMEKD